MLRQKSSAILLCEDAGEAPLKGSQDTDVEDIDHQEISRLGAMHADGPAQIVDLRQVDHLDVGGVVVVLDLPSRPVDALDAELVAGLHPRDHGDVRVPSIVQDVQLLGCGRDIDVD